MTNRQKMSIGSVIEGFSPPSTWETRNFPYIVDRVNESVNSDEVTHLTPSTVHGVVPKDQLDQNPQKALREGYELTPVEQGDFVVNMSSHEHGFEYCNISGGVSPDYMVLRPKVGEERTNFLKYLFKSPPFISILSALSSGIRQGKRIYWSDLKSIQVHLPTPAEAGAITKRLAFEVDQANRLFSLYTKLSELSRKKEQSQISHIVENGLTRSPMKQTELDWLNEIPVSWEIRSLKYCCDRIVDAINETAPTTDDGYAHMVRTTQIRDGRLDLEGADTVDKSTYQEWNRRETPRPRDLIFTREAPMGEACIIPSDEKIILGQRMMLIRPDKSILHPEYLLLWFYSAMAKYQYKLLSHGSTVKHLRVRDVPNLKIPIPPRDHQDDIVEELLSTRNWAKRLNDNIDSANSFLEQKRQALITAAVTGQIDMSEEKGVTQEHK